MQRDREVIVRIPKELEQDFRLFVVLHGGQIVEAKDVDIHQTVKEFLKGTRNNYHINITEGNNDNVVFDGTYAELKANRKDLLEKVVTSWDATPMADGTTDIGIMI